MVVVVAGPSLMRGPKKPTQDPEILGRPQSADKKFVRASGPPKSERRSVRPNERGVREPLHVEFALNNRELVKAGVFEERVFEQTAPLK